MADKFDPYREALVLETDTVWPDDLPEFDATEKARIAAALHQDPSACSQIEYIRLHTGFCRRITVTQEDIDRVPSHA